MKGTEKQIAWAEDIKANLKKTITAGIESIKNAEATEEQKSRAIKMWSTRLDAIENADYAGDIINLFRDVHFSGDVNRDIASIVSVYKVCPGDTQGERKILNK